MMYRRLKILDSQTMKSNSGLTLIEVMISTLVMLIAILGSYSMYVSQVNFESKTNRKVQSRTLMDQVISEVSASPQKFPNLKRATSSMAYVGCMSMDGIKDTTVNSGSNYNGLFLKDYGSFTASVCEDTTNKTTCSQKICQLPGVEVHIRYIDYYKAEITLLELTGTSMTSPSIQNMFQSTIFVNAHLSVPYGDVISTP